MNGFAINRIDPSARLGHNVHIGANVTIGCDAVIYDNVRIGDNTIIGPQCVLGEPTTAYYRDATYDNAELTIGASSIIRSGSVLYAGSDFGEGLQTGSKVCIREGTKLGRHCRVGTLANIEGRCEVGDYCSFHSQVFVAECSSIGDFVWLFPQVVLTNDPNPPVGPLEGVRIDDFAAIAARAVILPGVHIGRDALVGAHSLVRTNVPPETVVVGSPARPIGTIHDIKGRDGQPVYPWREHFDRGMPWAGIGYRRWNEQRTEAPKPSVR